MRFFGVFNRRQQGISQDRATHVSRWYRSFCATQITVHYSSCCVLLLVFTLCSTLTWWITVHTRTLCIEEKSEFLPHTARAQEPTSKNFIQSRPIYMTQPWPQGKGHNHTSFLSHGDNLSISYSIPTTCM